MDRVGGNDSQQLVACVVGTRPEAIKMAPVVAAIGRAKGLDVRLITTGQHRGILDRALADFGLVADLDLDLMRPDEILGVTTGRALIAISGALESIGPALVLAQGDTTTVVAAALASYYLKIPFGHVEAGLRTGHPYRPFPEEKNRVVASHLTTFHFAPTDGARDNLLREGIGPGSIHVTGNTVIDALRITAARPIAPSVVTSTAKFLLVTTHRRESHGEPMAEVCAAIVDLLEAHPDLSVVFPVHPNPRVRRVVEPALGGIDRVHLVEPQSYPEFVDLMRRAYLIMTDSGGVQEEAPSLGKPVLVLRDETERPEAVAAGTVRLVGTRRQSIRAAVDELLGDEDRYRLFATVVNPYGDGWAADRIARVILRHFGLASSPLPAGVAETWSSASGPPITPRR